jgi:hypothetical protein
MASITAEHAVSGTLLRVDEQVHVRARNLQWGWLPVLGLVSAAGLLMIALAYSAARNGEAWSLPHFWIGLLVMFVPIAYRLFSAEPEREERIGLLLIIGLALYLVKVMHSPVAFTFSDELIHSMTAREIIATNHLFTENPILPVSPTYPGMEIITAALSSLTGLSIVEAGMLVLGVARLVFILGLYLLYEQISGSEHIASIATIIYMGNANFVFFLAQYSYESLALPMMSIMLFLQTRYDGREHGIKSHIMIVALIAAAITITHHMTSYALILLLVIGALTAFVIRRGARTRLVISVALLVIGLNVAWTIFIGNPTAEYLGPVFEGGINELLQVVRGELIGRELFKSGTGELAPLWERLIGLGSVGLVVLAMPFGLHQLWRRYRGNAPALVMALVGIIYPLTLALRFTSRGWQIANRASEFVFVAVAFVAAVGIVGFWLSQRSNRNLIPVMTVLVTIIFMGGIIAGWPPWGRLPGPYLVSADTRSVEPQSIAAATWMYQYTGSGNRVAADRVNRLLIGAYGLQHIITHLNDKIDLSWVYFAEHLGQSQRQLIQRANAEYFVVDHRLTTMLPILGVYFEAGEPNSFRHETPIKLEALSKFYGAPGVSRVLDSGDIKIYDMSQLNVAP